MFSATPGDDPYAPTANAVSPTLIIGPHRPHECRVGVSSLCFSSCDCDSARFFYPIAGRFAIAPCFADTNSLAIFSPLSQQRVAPAAYGFYEQPGKRIDLLPTGHAGYK